MAKLLPLGTIVINDLEKSEKVLIIGRLVKKELDGEIFDYCGCIAPLGIQADEELIFFNHSDVKRLLFVGYQDEDELKYAVAATIQRDKLK